VRAPLARAYSTKGVWELGGSISFGYDKDFETKYEHLSLGLSASAGVFPVRRFLLGLSFGVVHLQTWGPWADSKTSSTELYLLVGPGLVLPIARGLFFFAQAQLGLAWEHSSYTQTLDSLRGVFGAKIGVKLLLGESVLLSIGLEPLFQVGKQKVDTGTSDPFKVDEEQLYLLLALGLSWFR
jgi:hypothetical protein